jgi:hypothetical protein
MTLGRSTSGNIKIKTDGGLRAVECGCCNPAPYQFVLGFSVVQSRVEKAVYEPSFITPDYPAWPEESPYPCGIIKKLTYSHSNVSFGDCEFGDEYVIRNAGGSMTAELVENSQTNFISINQKTNFKTYQSSSLVSGEVESPYWNIAGDQGGKYGVFEIANVSGNSATSIYSGTNFSAGTGVGLCGGGPYDSTPFTFTTTLELETESFGKFVKDVFEDLPSFPAHFTDACLFMQDFVLPTSASSKIAYSAEIPASKDCSDLKITRLDITNTEYKILHNKSPTGFLKVWVKEGDIDIATGNFSSSEVWEYTWQSTSTNDSCDTFFSPEKTLYVIESDIPNLDLYPVASFTNRYAYILKYSFLQNYTPQTQGEGIYEYSINNGFPP